MTRGFTGLLAALLLFAGSSTARDRGAHQPWVTAWASAQQAPDARNRLPADGEVTLRQVIRVTAGGRQVRIRLSNVFGTAPLVLAGVHIALSQRPGSAAIRSGSDRAITFANAPGVTLAAGADGWSDPVALPLAAGDSLAVSLRLTIPSDGQTIHTASHATSFLIAGDHLSAPDLPSAERIEHWAFLSGVDVANGQAGPGIIALGDSITDGSWSTTDGNDRWPDVLADRLRAQAPTRDTAVLNLGIGGNRLLLDGNGTNALARFDRDVLAQAGAGFLVVLEGINDIGTLSRDGPVTPEQHRALVARITGAYRQIAVRARRAGLTVFGGTLLPFAGAKAYPVDAAAEADRAVVNAWIRKAGVFDGVIDFDLLVRDPAHPERLLPAYDSGDHLHPSPAGYRRMGEGIPLTLFGSRPRKR